MALTKEEIQFIDRYLKKNKVKFWDVRLELLDHIVSSVEDKMTTQQASFETGLLEVHRGLGSQLIKGSIPKEQLFPKSLYQSNIGFKKFIKIKQIEAHRKKRKQTWFIFKRLITSPLFIIAYLLIILGVVLVFQFHSKTALFLSLFLVSFPLLCSKNMFSNQH